jgi:hypothetical protein
VRRPLELGWADPRVRLRGVDAHVPQHRAHGLEIMVLLENHHRDAVRGSIGKRPDRSLKVCVVSMRPVDG